MTGDTRATVLGLIRGNPGMSPAGVAARTGLGRDAVKKAMQRMAADGTLRSDGRGHYIATARRHLSPVPAARDTGDTVAPAANVPASPGEDTPGSWRCGCCHHLQAIRSVAHCEFCGASPDWGSPL